MARETLSKLDPTFENTVGKNAKSPKISWDSVDDRLIKMVRQFNNNRQSGQKIALYNGVDGSLLIDPSQSGNLANRSYQLNIFILLGHMLTKLTDANVPTQLKMKQMAKIPPGTQQKTRAYVRWLQKVMPKQSKGIVVQGQQVAAINEVNAFDATLRQWVRDNKSQMQVISYVTNSKLVYNYQSTNGSTQKIISDRYLYQGIIPEQFRGKKKQVYLYVRSIFPPMVALDMATIQRSLGIRANSKAPLHETVMKSVYTKKRRLKMPGMPGVIKRASAEDVGVVAAGVGVGTLGLSSMLMVL